MQLWPSFLVDFRCVAHRWAEGFLCSECICLTLTSYTPRPGPRPEERSLSSGVAPLEAFNEPLFIHRRIPILLLSPVNLISFEACLIYVHRPQAAQSGLRTVMLLDISVGLPSMPGILIFDLKTR